MSVKFIEEGHKYIDEEGNFYTSTTTVIGKYKEPFDAEYWSKYKAIERFITETKGEDKWLEFKSEVGYKKVNITFDEKAKEESKAAVAALQSAILVEWEVEKNIACFNGSNFHQAKEQGWLSSDVHFEGVKYKNWHKLGVQDMGGINVNPKDLPDGVYSELILWNNQYRVAGAADIVYIETVNGIRYIDIDDYKTNKKIETSSFKDRFRGRYKTMLHPLSQIMDCNALHYTLQLSCYALYLEKFGFTPRFLNFQHWKNVSVDSEGNPDKLNPLYKFEKNYEVEYKRKEVIAMLEHHKRKYINAS